MSSSDRRFGEVEGFEDARPAFEARPLRFDYLRSPLALRLSFLAACAAAVAVTLYVTGAGGLQSADPELDKLLKGMAIIKSVIILFAGAAIWWRLGSPIGPSFAAGYILFAATAIGGAALVWNRSQLGLAPFLFDGGLLAFLILALRDDNGPWLRSLTRGRTSAAAASKSADRPPT